MSNAGAGVAVNSLGQAAQKTAQVAEKQLAVKAAQTAGIQNFERNILAKELNFTNTTMKVMENPKRYVPVKYLHQQLIMVLNQQILRSL